MSLGKGIIGIAMLDLVPRCPSSITVTGTTFVLGVDMVFLLIFVKIYFLKNFLFHLEAELPSDFFNSAPREHYINPISW